tara:strand:- start:769 stop:1308 length:540 start_codon:yes stop_codon:yes gene_type:complete
MKLNKNLKLLLILVVGILCFYGFKNYAEKVKNKHSIATSISSKLFDFNTFELKVDSNLILSDFKVVNQNSGTTIFMNGEKRKGIDNDYGHRLYELYYNDQKLYEFGHFSTNNWYTFDYTLNLNKINNRIEPDLKIMRGKNESYNDFFYKRFEYNESGKLVIISYLTLGKEVYNIKIINE